MKVKIVVFLFSMIVMGFLKINGQTFFRYEADYSIKEKSIIESPVLTIGKVYFDINNRSIVYDINFPERELVIMNDSLIVKIKDNRVVEMLHTANFIDFSIFSLMLSGDLPYFGLNNTTYKLTNIEKDQGMVISTWEPPDKFREQKGKMLLSQIDKKLNGLISYDAEGKIMSKQFFTDYQMIDGLEIPATITQFLYVGMDEKIKLTTYKNIKLNNLDNEEFYNYSIPAY